MLNLESALISFVTQAGLLACLAFPLAACSTKTSAPAPVMETPPPVVGNGTGSDAVPAVVPVVLGQETRAKGDVMKDENGLFSLARSYTLKLDKETSLQVRKTLANGNCGAPNGSFIFMKGEEQVADVTIDHAKDYGGRPKETLAHPLAAGDYTVLAFITLDQECKDALFFYDFVIETAS